MVLKPIKIKGLSLRRKELIMSDYARRAAELDINDYLSQHPAYVEKKNELLALLKRGIK